MSNNGNNEDKKSGEDPQQKMQLLFDIKGASKILGGMKRSTIRKHVHAGRLKRCEHLGSRPWYFTMEQLEEFINNELRSTGDEDTESVE